MSVNPCETSEGRRRRGLTNGVVVAHVARVELVQCGIAESLHMAEAEELRAAVLVASNPGRWRPLCRWDMDCRANTVHEVVAGERPFAVRPVRAQAALVVLKRLGLRRGFKQPCARIGLRNGREQPWPEPTRPSPESARGKDLRVGLARSDRYPSLLESMAAQAAPFTLPVRGFWLKSPARSAIDGTAMSPVSMPSVRRVPW